MSALSTQKLRIGIVIAILCLLAFVALRPESVYAPVPKVILFLLAAIFPAIFIATTAATKFKLEGPGFAFITTGASAFFLVLLLVLSHLARPELQVVTFDVVDERGMKVDLSPHYAFSLAGNAGGLTANHFVKGNSVILIFPEQLSTQRVSVRLAQDSREYSGIVSYAKPPTVPLRVGLDLK